MIYSVKRFSGDDEKKGMGLGTKLALGTAAVGGTLLAGRAGLLGSKVQKGIGTATAAVGKKLGAQRLVNDGAKTVGNAARTSAKKTLGIDTLGKARDMAKENMSNFKAATNIVKSEQANATQGILDKFKIGK